MSSLQKMIFALLLSCLLFFGGCTSNHLLPNNIPSEGKIPEDTKVALVVNRRSITLSIKSPPPNPGEILPIFTEEDANRALSQALENHIKDRWFRVRDIQTVITDENQDDYVEFTVAPTAEEIIHYASLYSAETILVIDNVYIDAKYSRISSSNSSNRVYSPPNSQPGLELEATVEITFQLYHGSNGKLLDYSTASESLKSIATNKGWTKAIGPPLAIINAPTPNKIDQVIEFIVLDYGDEAIGIIK